MLRVSESVEEASYTAESVEEAFLRGIALDELWAELQMPVSVKRTERFPCKRSTAMLSTNVTSCQSLTPVYRIVGCAPGLVPIKVLELSGGES